MAVTIRDVAKMAGVSTSTVSIVYNSGPSTTRVSEKKRRKVEDAIRKLGYEPNSLARSVSLKRFEAIGVAVDSDAISLGPGRFYMQVLGGVGVVCAIRNYLCTMSCVCTTPQHVPKFLRPKSVDMFLAAHGLSTEAYAQARQAGVPIILVNSAERSDLPCVNFDESATTRLTLDRLAAMGHRRIAYISSFHNRDHYSHADRMNAYIDWSRSRGNGTCITQSGNEMTWSDADTAELVQWVRQLVEQPDPVTAIVAYSSFAPLALMKALPGAGIQVPQQVSLATVASEPTDPPELAGALYDPFELGQVAGNEAIDAITQKRPPTTRLIVGKWRAGISVGVTPHTVHTENSIRVV